MREILHSSPNKSNLNVMVKIHPLLSTLLIFVGCTSSSEVDPLLIYNENVLFSVEMESLTRGSLVSSEKQMGSMGIYCAYTKDTLWSESVIFDRMYDKRLDYNTELKEWVYEGDTPMWDNESMLDRYTFMGYSPYGDSETNGVESRIESGDLVVSYTTPSSCALQCDLMMAIPRKDIYPQIMGAVSLNFKHVLSSIGFSVVGSSTKIITNIAIKNVVDSGECTISDSGEVVWELGDTSDREYSAIIDPEITPNIYDSQTVTLSNGYLMMIPQPSDNIEVIVTLYDTDEQSDTQKSLSLSGVGNWEAGKTYEYLIDIASYDYTIEGTSNCYMLHPNGTTQTFYIPVEGRINTFWRDYADDLQSYKDMLSSHDEWSAVVVWEDIDGNMNNFSVERVTCGYSPSESVTPLCEPDFTTMGARSAMKITLPDNITEGNIVVAVEFNDQILWSWHLWITEYNPDIIAANNSVTLGQYVYATKGVEGNVHRYDSEGLWATLYDDCFIMDRNLGARDCDYSNNRSGVLHYQFGRKDPFPAESSFDATLKEAQVSFVEAVKNPTTFFLRKQSYYSWSIEGLELSGYLWFDKNLANSTSVSGKSIFDPSPLGWQVPRYGTFTMLNNNNCEYSPSDYVMIYNDEIKLPFTGYRSNNTGNVNDYGSQGSLRLSTQINSSSAYNLVYNSDIDPNTNNTMADGFCVRCIEE